MMDKLTNKGHIPNIDIEDLCRYLIDNKSTGEDLLNEIRRNLNDNPFSLRAPYKLFWLTLFKHRPLRFLIYEAELDNIIEIRAYKEQPNSKWNSMVIFTYDKSKPSLDFRKPNKDYLPFSYFYFKNNDLFSLDILKDDEANEIHTLLVNAYLILYTLFFINIKNVKIVDEQRFLEKIKENSHNKGNKQIIYKVLTIEFKKKLYYINEIFNHNFNKKNNLPRFRVRGHYRYYSTEKPLFGKLTGWFFIPTFWKGELKNGEIVKDYKVKI